MFQRILVPVDFSEQNQRSVEIAVELATAAGGTVHLLHIIEMIADSSMEEFGDFYATIEREANQKMELLLASHKATPIQIESMVRYGNRVLEIVQIANEQTFDLIVMNSHRVDLNNPTANLGTISYKVSMLATSPVLLVK